MFVILILLIEYYRKKLYNAYNWIGKKIVDRIIYFLFKLISIYFELVWSDNNLYIPIYM